MTAGPLASAASRFAMLQATWPPVSPRAAPAFFQSGSACAKIGVPSGLFKSSRAVAPAPGPQPVLVVSAVVSVLAGVSFLREGTTTAPPAPVTRPCGLGIEPEHNRSLTTGTARR